MELPKFTKTLSELNSLTDKWIYFLKETAYLKTIPDNLGEVPEIERALNIANQANMTTAELEVIDRRAIVLQDEIGKITKARDDGRFLEAIAFVIRLLKKRFGEIPTEIEDRVRELSLEDLESLGEAIFDFNDLEDLLAWLGEKNSNNEI